MRSNLMGMREVRTWVLESSPVGDDRTRMRQNRIGVRANRMESARIVSECKRIVYDCPRIVVNCVRIERECVMIIHECIVLISEYMRTVQECRSLWDFPHPQSCVTPQICAHLVQLTFGLSLY